MQIKNLKLIYFIQVFLLISAIQTYIFGMSGVLDPSFGTNGIVQTTIGTSAQINALAIQTDGKLVAGGFATISGSQQFAVARYTTNGSLDTTFGTGGIVNTALTGLTVSPISAILIQPADGKIVAAGTGNNGTFATSFVVRLNTDGSFDTSFGTNGIYFGVLPLSTTRSLAIQTNGEIIVGGQSGGMLIYRLTTSGVVDVSFGGGIIIIESNAAANALAIQSNGSIVAGGQSATEIIVARVLTDGSLDSSFGSGGTVTFNLSAGADETMLGMILQSNGDIVGCGISEQTSNNYPFILRLTNNGSFDTTFGSGTGFAIFTSNPGVFNGIAMQSDGKYVCAGEINGNTSWLLARINSNGTIDTSYGTNGFAITTIGGSEEAKGLVIQANNEAVAGGFSTTTQSLFTLARYTSASPTLNFTTSQSGSLFVPAPGLLTGQTPSPTTFPILLTPPNNGIVTIYPDGSFVYVPNANFNGTDSFTYTLSINGVIISFVGTVSITVTANEPSPNSGIGALLVHAIRQKYGTKS